MLGHLCVFKTIRGRVSRAGALLTLKLKISGRWGRPEIYQFWLMPLKINDPFKALVQPFNSD
jgi:hypothetical protein